ncbi:hypothetical protein [Spirillospora albida]|uniref:hypothetical protein n=1 Tax=Spirillospora albida TaxID=58123 RepID=UPI0004C1B8B1|nr:hypothetical protein [Spirillospora albida]
MLHHEIMSAAAKDRARELRAEAKAARDAALARRARAFWEEYAARFPVRRRAAPPARLSGAARM